MDTNIKKPSYKGEGPIVGVGGVFVTEVTDQHCGCLWVVADWERHKEGEGRIHGFPKTDGSGTKDGGTEVGSKKNV